MGRCLTSSLSASIRKALCVLAAPQCPAEIEREVKSSWQDLSLGTDKQQEGFPATWSEPCHEGWLQGLQTWVENWILDSSSQLFYVKQAWSFLLKSAPGFLCHLKANHQQPWGLNEWPPPTYLADTPCPMTHLWAHLSLQGPCSGRTQQFVTVSPGSRPMTAKIYFKKYFWINKCKNEFSVGMYQIWKGTIYGNTQPPRDT